MSWQSQAQGSGPGGWLLGTLKQNPEGLLLLAAGCALLMRTGTSSRPHSSARSWEPPATGRLSQATESATQAAGAAQRYAADTASGASQYAADTAGQAKEYAADMAAQTSEAARSYAASAADYAGKARRTVTEQSQRAFEQARSTLQGTLDRVLDEQPLMVALAGLAAGAAVAATFPATRFEEETLGPVGEQVTDAAQRMGGQLKEAAVKAGDTLKESAEEHGLTPGSVKEVVGEAAETFRDTMAGTEKQASGGPDRSDRPSR